MATVSLNSKWHNTTKGLVYYCKEKLNGFDIELWEKKFDEIVRNFLSGLN